MLGTALLERPDTHERRLRLVLATNAMTSGLGGLAAVGAGAPVDSLLGTDATAWVRGVGAGLVVFSALVAVVARATSARLASASMVVSIGDAAWVVGTFVTIVLGWYSTLGAILMATVGTAVGSFGVAQTVLARRLSSDD